MTGRFNGALAIVFIALLLTARPAIAALEWAVWGPPSGNTSVGVFGNGQQVLLGANFTGITAGHPAGSIYTSSPAIPGRPDNTNPAYQGMLTGPPSTFLAAGDPVMALDLADITGNTGTVFGYADHKQGGVEYILELRDASLAQLPVTGLVVTPYNLTYTSDGLVADLNSVLNTTTSPGRLGLDNLHDAGGTYRHTGLTTFSNLPPGTRYIALFAVFDNQEVEGLQVYLATDTTSGVVVTDSEGAEGDHAIAFGESTIGVLQVHTVTVNNFAASPIAIAITESLAPPFGIADPDDCNLTLPPNGSCTVTVSYQPDSTGNSVDSLTLDLGGTPQTVAVSGTGVLPQVEVTDSLAPTTDRSLQFANSVPVGATGTATVTITNPNSVDVTVQLTETLAAPYGFVDAASCDGITLTPNQSCTLTVQFAPDAIGVFEDSFSFSAGGSSVTITVNGTPGLANSDFGVTTSIDPPIVQPGVSGSDLTTVTITVTNSGPDAGTPLVSYPVPPGMTLVSATPDQGTYDPVTGQWTPGPLADGATASVELRLQATAVANGCISSGATVTAGAGGVDPASGNNAAAIVIAAPACADLAMASTAVTDNVRLMLGMDRTNTRVQHNIRIVNRGPAPATGVVVVVSAYNFNPNDVDTFRTVLPPQPRMVEVGDLAVGEERLVLIADFEFARPHIDLDVAVIVSVTSPGPDPDPENNDSIGSFVVPGSAESNCFIATAAYGSYLEPEVALLRQFRDRFLLTNRPGQAFVAWYYRVSPPIADYIRDRPLLRSVVRSALAPVVYAIREPMAAGTLLLVLLLLPAWMKGRQRRTI